MVTDPVNYGIFLWKWKVYFWILAIFYLFRDLSTIFWPVIFISCRFILVSVHFFLSTVKSCEIVARMTSNMPSRDYVMDRYNMTSSSRRFIPRALLGSVARVQDQHNNGTNSNIWRLHKTLHCNMTSSGPVTYLFIYLFLFFDKHNNRTKSSFRYW